MGAIGYQVTLIVFKNTFLGGKVKYFNSGHSLIPENDVRLGIFYLRVGIR